MSSTGFLSYFIMFLLKIIYNSRREFNHNCIKSKYICRVFLNHLKSHLLPSFVYHELSIDAKCIKILFNFNDGSFLLKEVHGIYYHIHSITLIHKIVLRKHILLKYNYNFSPFCAMGRKHFLLHFNTCFFGRRLPLTLLLLML